VYILSDGNSASPDLSLSTNTTFIENNTAIELALFSQSIVFSFDSTTIIEVRLLENSNSLGFYKILSSENTINTSISIKIPPFATNRQFLTLDVILYGNGRFLTTTKNITFQVYPGSPINPFLVNHQINTVLTSSTLIITANEPVTIEVIYGDTIGSLVNHKKNVGYVMGLSLNLSELMVLDSYNYYYFTLTDSLGSSSIYNNNSNYFKVFIQKLDSLLPYNTTSIVVTGDYHIQFTSNEPVKVTITCIDFFNTLFTCYSSDTYQTDIYGQLQLHLPGITYRISTIKLVDQALNESFLYPNIIFFY
jgi:hypothetical protein